MLCTMTVEAFAMKHTSVFKAFTVKRISIFLSKAAQSITNFLAAPLIIEDVDSSDDSNQYEFVQLAQFEPAQQSYDCHQLKTNHNLEQSVQFESTQQSVISKIDQKLSDGMDFVEYNGMKFLTLYKIHQFHEQIIDGRAIKIYGFEDGKDGKHRLNTVVNVPMTYLRIMLFNSKSLDRNSYFNICYNYATLMVHHIN